MQTIINDQAAPLDTGLAGRLAELLGIPAELFLGVPGESTDERLAREDAARDILDADPLLAVRARSLAELVAAAHRNGEDVVEFKAAEVVEVPVPRTPLAPAALKAAA